MYSDKTELYEFGNFRLDVNEHRLSRTDGTLAGQLPEKAFQTLVLLVRKAGNLVNKQELLAAVWADANVEENNLDKAVHLIRQVLGEKPGEQKYIETVRKHGYRFVIEVIRMHIGDGASLPAIVSPPKNARGGTDRLKNAYEAVQRARIKYYEMTESDVSEARDYLERAFQLDPDFAPAYSLSAELATLEVIVGFKSPASGLAEARAAIKHAFELGADSEDHYAAAGYVNLIADWDFPAAEANLRKALSINPHYGPSNRKMGEILMFQGRHEEAAVFVRRAQVDELTSIVNANILAISRFLARDYPAVLEVCDRMLELSPRHLIPSWTKCWAFEQMGRLDQAIAGYEKILRLPHGQPALRWAGYVYALAGNREKAKETIAALEAVAPEHNISPTHIAAVYAALGEIEMAIPLIEKGFDKRDPFMLWIGTDPRFDVLRPHPRFKAVIDVIGFFAWKEKRAGDVESKDETNAVERADETVSARFTRSGAHRLVGIDEWVRLSERLSKPLKEDLRNLGASEAGESSPSE